MIKPFAIALAGILGASGVAAAAAASHAGAQLMQSYSLIALTHAPALLVLALIALPRVFTVALLTLSAGTILFCADIAVRYGFGHALFPMSAPIGGMLMIAGWLILGFGAIAIARR